MENQSLLEKIKALTGRMADQISHIRRFARRPDAQLRAIELKAVIADALSLLEHRFDEEETELRLDLADETMLVLAEPIRLEQVVVNLVTNALDAVKETTRRSVTVTARPTADGASLIVADTGSGIATADLQAVFDPFFTTKPAGTGLGLGLSISYNIVKDFGADITVIESGPQGTRFQVRLKGPER